MKNLVLMLAVAALALLVPSSGWTQATTDYSEMDQWVKDSANQGEVPTGTHINMQNWQQYKQYMPLGMVKLFQGQYYWKMPPDVDIEVGPTHLGSRLKSFQDFTEKYSPQVQVKVLPNGHYQLLNYLAAYRFQIRRSPTRDGRFWLIFISPMCHQSM